MQGEYKYADITKLIIGVAFEVHKTLKNGFVESVYHRSMEIEFRNTPLKVQALNYLEVFNLEVGLLINFGAKSLEVRRLYNTKYKPSPIV